MSSQKGRWGSYSVCGRRAGLSLGLSSLVTRGKEVGLWGSQFQHESFYIVCKQEARSPERRR